MVDREAAWGFVAEKEALVVYASILPCTVALEFDPGVPEGALLRARHCYDDLAPRIEDATGAYTPATRFIQVEGLGLESSTRACQRGRCCARGTAAMTSRRGCGTSPVRAGRQVHSEQDFRVDSL